MSSERQKHRQTALKAWETIRRKYKKTTSYVHHVTASMPEINWKFIAINTIISSIVSAIIVSALILNAPSFQKALTGPQGEQGIQGDQGIQGEIGSQGIQGIQGEIGPQGIQGIEGEVGPQGLQGVTGSIGPQGEQGPQGNNFSVQGTWIQTFVEWIIREDYVDETDWARTFNITSDFWRVEWYVDSEPRLTAPSFLMRIHNITPVSPEELETPLYEETQLIAYASRYGGDSITQFGKGLYRIEITTRRHDDVRLKIWEFQPSSD